MKTSGLAVAGRLRERRGARGPATWTVAVLGTLWLAAPVRAAAPQAASDDRYGAERDPGITVTAPNGGETWPADSAQMITWDCTGPAGLVRITLLKSGAEYAHVGYAPMSVGEFEWTVCDLVGDASDYALAIACESCAPPVADVSDAPFTISGSALPPTLTVTSPGGGEVWAAGTTRTITWDSTNPSGCVDIWLLADGARDIFVGSVGMAAEAFTWDICPFLGDGNAYAIELAWLGSCGPPVQAASATPFTVTGSIARPTLTVTSPNGGEAWAANGVHSVTWQSTNARGTVEIWLTNNDWLHDYLGTAPVTAGQFAWAASPCHSGTTDLRVLLRWSACGRAVEDASDNVFALTGAFTPTLTVLSPAGGEVWSAGSSQLIAWQSDAVVGDVNVELLQGGRCYAHLGRVPVAAGGLPWDICPGIGNGTYAVRLGLEACAVQVTSVSFTIAGSRTPRLTLLSLADNAPGVWPAGTPFGIGWKSRFLTGDLHIYVPNDGWFHSGHAVVPVEAGGFLWPIAPTLIWPPPPGLGSGAGIWLYSYDCGQVVKVLGAPFEVTPFAGTLGDLDADGDVDLEDWAHVQACCTERGRGLLHPGCDALDFEPDGDVDLDDGNVAALSMMGPG